MKNREWHEIGLLDQMPEVKALREEMDQRADAYKVERDALQERAKAAKNKFAEDSAGYWNKIAGAIQERGLTPEGFVFNKTHSFKVSDNAIAIREMNADSDIVDNDCNCAGCMIARMIGVKPGSEIRVEVQDPPQ